MEKIDVEFISLDEDEKIILLDVLGYTVDENGIIYDKDTMKEHICPLTNEAVFIENASIMPGSTVVMNTNELSLSEYFSKYIEKITV
jgi:hypothetical protein